MACKGSLVSVLGMLLLVTLFLKLVTVSGQNIPVVGLFTFGDSSFDAGNKKFLTSASLPQNFWPYGKSRDDPKGKFSDGKIVPDFIAKFMGIPHDLPPALKPGANVSRGASFAVGSASISSWFYKRFLIESESTSEEIQSNWKEDYIGKSVFMISIGMEDYYNFTKHNPNADVSAQQALVASVTSRLKNDISLLYSSGASKFVVQLVPPLGCLPITRQEFKTGNDCYEKLNDLAKQHNAKIGPMLNEMAETKPGFQFTVFDFYNVILRRTQRNMNYREVFRDKLIYRVAVLGRITHMVVVSLTCTRSYASIKELNYLYFDGSHNTEKAQESFAHLLFGADPNVIQPMTVRELIVYPVDEPMREFWKEPMEENSLLIDDVDVEAFGSVNLV